MAHSFTSFLGRLTQTESHLKPESLQIIIWDIFTSSCTAPDTWNQGHRVRERTLSPFTSNTVQHFWSTAPVRAEHMDSPCCSSTFVGKDCYSHYRRNNSQIRQYQFLQDNPGEKRFPDSPSALSSESILEHHRSQLHQDLHVKSPSQKWFT